MQTLLPFPNYHKSAQCLDRQRLGKQRVEALQVAKALLDPGYGWQHHPGVEMWRGYELALVAYGLAVCQVWTARGYQDSCYPKLQILGRAFRLQGKQFEMPWWYGMTDIHVSHQSNLTRKMPEHYLAFWNTPAGQPYYWPKGKK
jgi:hypothetical protein